MLSSWVIRPQPNAAPMSQDGTGSHIYQLDLKKMKVMPYSDYVHKNFIGKGKHKADKDCVGSLSPSKKVVTCPSSPAWSDVFGDEDAMEV